MVVRGHPSLSLTRQCRLLSIGRSSLYDRPKGESAETLALMRRIDALFLKYPFYGARQMVRHLRREGVRIGRRRAARLMRLLGLQAVYRAPRTSAPHLGHRVYPYLLRGLAIERPNHVWCADITYIPVRRGFLYLVAIMDWASRCVLAWRLSNTLDAGFCVEALDEALARHGTPQIFNTDQGSQFTGFAFTARLREAGIRISMDGRGRCMDNIFIERLWRSLKYEAVYLHEIADGFAARRVIGQWIGFYNTERPHSALGGRTPAEAYRGDTPVDMMDKPLRALTTYPQAQQQQQKDRSKRILAAQTSTGIHLENAVSLSDKPTPPPGPGAKPAMTGRSPAAARPRRSPAPNAAERCGISAPSLPGAANIRPADRRMRRREPASCLDPDSADILSANQPARPRARPHARQGPDAPSIFACPTPKTGSRRNQLPQPDNNRHTASPARRLSPHTSHIANASAGRPRLRSIGLSRLCRANAILKIRARVRSRARRRPGSQPSRDRLDPFPRKTMPKARSGRGRGLHPRTPEVRTQGVSVRATRKPKAWIRKSGPNQNR